MTRGDEPKRTQNTCSTKENCVLNEPSLERPCPRSGLLSAYDTRAMFKTIGVASASGFCWKVNQCSALSISHDDVIKWKHFSRYWPFVRRIHWWPVDSPPNGQWRGALMFALICALMNGWVKNREADYLRCHNAHNDVTVMSRCILFK